MANSPVQSRLQWSGETEATPGVVTVPLHDATGSLVAQLVLDSPEAVQQLLRSLLFSLELAQALARHQ